MIPAGKTLFEAFEMLDHFEAFEYMMQNTQDVYKRQGLVGYTSDEVNRRRKEIAIRKVNGAKVKDILRIFLKDIMKRCV